MRADDHRHGTNAGATAHWKDGEPPCAPCALAKSRAAKRAALDAVSGRRRTVALPLPVHQWLTGTPVAETKRLTGLADPTVRRLIDVGPGATIRRTTLDKITAAMPLAESWTNVGLTRRIRALHALGWSAAQIGREAGVAATSVIRIRDAQSVIHVRRDFAQSIVEAYARLSMRLPVATTIHECGATTRARLRADSNGWPPPLAWDDIDRDEQAHGQRPAHDDWRSPDEVDEVVIDRLMSGERGLRTTRAEREQIVTRWVASGGSEREICQQFGWRDGGRYLLRDQLLRPTRPAEEAS